MQPDDFWRTIRRYGATSALLLSMAGCAANSDPQPGNDASTADLPNIVATSSVLCDLTQQIAQDTVNLTCLMQPGQDPHVYAPTPSDRQAIEEAELVLYGGYNYESGLIRIIQATQTNAPKAAVYELAVPQPLQGEAHDHADDESEDEHGHDESTAVDEDHGHAAEAEVPDPHVWHDAANGVQLVDTIRDQLVAIAPTHSTLYRQNSEILTRELSEIDTWIKTQVATIPPSARKLVTTHESFGYYARAYGLTVAGALSGISTEARPSATRLTQLVKTVEAAQVPAIFVEATANPQLIQTVAREAKVAIADPPLFVEGPGDENSIAPTYQLMLITNTCTIVNALGGTCDPATLSQPEATDQKPL